MLLLEDPGIALEETVNVLLLKTKLLNVGFMVSLSIETVVAPAMKKVLPELNWAWYFPAIENNRNFKNSLR
jgi:hypothetical protein